MDNGNVLVACNSKVASGKMRRKGRERKKKREKEIRSYFNMCLILIYSLNVPS